MARGRPTWHRRCRQLIRRLHRDEGQSLVLAIGLCAVTLLTISVVLGAAAVNLKARQLLAIADGAVVAAVDEFEFTGDGPTPQIRLTTDRVRQGAAGYLADTGAFGRVDNLAIAGVQVLPDGQGAELTLTGTVSPPLIGWVVPDGIPLTVRSTARTVLTR